MSLIQSYLRSSPRTKALLGAGIITWATMGLYGSDAVGAAFGFNPSKEDEEKLKEALPKIVPIDRELNK